MILGGVSEKRKKSVAPKYAKNGDLGNRHVAKFRFSHARDTRCPSCCCGWARTQCMPLAPGFGNESFFSAPLRFWLLAHSDSVIIRINNQIPRPRHTPPRFSDGQDSAESSALPLPAPTLPVQTCPAPPFPAPSCPGLPNCCLAGLLTCPCPAELLI